MGLVFLKEIGDMTNPEIENRILKYFGKEATSDDLDFLSDWILVEENQKVFDAYVQTHFEIIMTMNAPDTGKIKSKLLRRIKQDKKRRVLNIVVKYAAVVTLLVALAYLHYSPTVVVEPGGLVPKEESITITFDDGSVDVLSTDKDKSVKDAQGIVVGIQTKSKLTYQGSNVNKELIYNTLMVPYGKRFDVVLSDGTHIFLNSGTSLRYPVTFLKDTTRTVFLSGEAYFEVAKDERRPFVVNANAVDIKVLGTKFNVSRYPEDSNISTVLVEGSVELLKRKGSDDGKKTMVLQPGFKAEWHGANNEISVEKVDTRVYTAWVEGKLVFRNTPFLKIRKALERKYNVIIRNRNADLDNQLFDATFDIETIQEVLESFNKSYALDYQIINNEVVIE